MATFLQPIAPVIGYNETVSNVTLSNSVVVGTAWGDAAGNQYVYAYNGSNSQISQGQFAVLQTNASGYSVTITNATSVDIAIGICRNTTMPTASYGWLMTKGFTGLSTDNVSFATNQCCILGLNGNMGAAPTSVGSFVTSVIVGKALISIPTQTTCSTAGNSNSFFIDVL